MRFSRIALTLFCLFILNSNVHPQVPEGVKVEVIDGVTCIHNPAKPVHPRKTVRFEEELVISGEDEDGEVYVYQFYSFYVDPKGMIYIPDHNDKAIKVFDHDGRFITAIGRAGQGPGEFQRVSDIGILPDGKMIVLDGSTRRTSIFSKDHKFIRSQQWIATSGSYSEILLEDEKAFFAPKEYFARDKKRNKDLVQVSLDDGSEETKMTGLPNGEDFKVQMEGGRFLIGQKPQAVRAYFAEDRGRGLIYFLKSDAYLIHVYDRNWKLLKKIDREYTLLPFTTSDKAAFFKRFDNPHATGALSGIKKLNLPKHKTLTEKIVVDDLGNLWIKTQETRKVRGKTCFAYDIFDANGYYDARIWTDLEPDTFVNGKMYQMVWELEERTATVRRNNVVWEAK